MMKLEVAGVKESLEQVVWEIGDRKSRLKAYKKKCGALEKDWINKYEVEARTVDQWNNRQAGAGDQETEFQHELDKAMEQMESLERREGETEQEWLKRINAENKMR